MVPTKIIHNRREGLTVVALCLSSLISADEIASILYANIFAYGISSGHLYTFTSDNLSKSVGNEVIGGTKHGHSQWG